ncbi:MAG: DUF3877 family protein [Lachnospiraceae bacterium]
MNKEKLINNIIDQVQEMQLKLGFANESVSLYYPYDSIRFLLETDLDNSALADTLIDIISQQTLGEMQLKATKSRVVVTLSPATVENIYLNYPPSDFLKDIIALFSDHHGLTMDNVAKIFEKYSPDYVSLKMPEDSDFDYVFYFKNPEIDSFYYCVKDEIGHIIYHRFIESDYKALIC